ncbi:MAG TPA: RNA ligase [Thermoanaerobaculia bacterium]|jgi:hypothetical protein|nr:RNA ligase [Thermoanaerobaculia bacterium]
MLEIQKALRAGVTYEELLAKYAIKHRRHGAHPNLVLLKYHQVDSPFAEKLVRECRGIVLDEADDWKVVARAFDKFFNHGEGHAAAIDWTTARVQEKVDGSMCCIFAYKGEWHVATTGTPDGSGDVNGVGTFAEYFWKTLDWYGNPFTMFDPVDGMCFFFELAGPANRVVVVHDRPHLTLLGGRRSWDREMTIDYTSAFLSAVGCEVPAVRSFGLQSFEELAASFATMSPLAQEGYVVVDAAFNRVKVKHPGYVALHHARGGMTKKAFVEIARSGEVSEVLTAFPEFRPLLEDAQRRVDGFVAEVSADYERLKDIEVQKDFAIEAVKTKCSGALFAVRAKKASSVRAFIATMRIENLMQLLGYKAEEAAEEAKEGEEA